MDFNDKRVEKIKGTLKEYIDKAEKSKLKKVEPIKQTIDNINKIIFNYIKEKKRVVYGGAAINEYIIQKNPKLKIYDEFSIADYDVYTPEPLYDLIYICNLLHEKGYKNVRGKEAVHDGTYSVMAEYYKESVFDLHYVWKGLYHKLPTNTINGIRYIDPSFIFVDIYKVYTDPLLSFNFRIEKVFHRGNILEKYYSFKNDSDIQNTQKQLSKLNNISDNKNIINHILKKIVENNKDILLCGSHAYNYYIKKSKIKNTILEQLETLSIMTNKPSYYSDKIFNILKKKVKDPTKLQIIHFHPFLELIDKKINILYHDNTIITIYGNNKRCVPYKRINKRKYRILTYHGMLMLYYSKYIYYKCKDNHSESRKLKFLIYQIQNVRIKYLQMNNYIGIEKMPFQELIIKCKWNAHSDSVEYGKRIEKKVKLNKGPYTFVYNPVKRKLDPSKPPQLIFPNTSGNIIKSAL